MNTKRCSSCGLDKPLEQFSMKNTQRGTRHSACKSCSGRYGALNHQAKKAGRNPAIHKVARAQRAVLQDLATSVVQTVPCTACGGRWADGADIVLVPGPELTNGRPMSAIIRCSWSTQRFLGLLQQIVRQPDGVLCRTCLGKSTQARLAGGMREHTRTI